MSSHKHLLISACLTISSLFLLSCHNNDIDPSVILSVDKFQLTQYEANKQLSRSFRPDQVKNKKNLNQFKNDLIATAYILADAYNKGYDTLPEIQKNVHYVSDFMMTQKYGYLWNTSVTPRINKFAKPSSESLKKRAFLYSFDILEFTDKSDVLLFLGSDSVLRNHQEFMRLKEYGTQSKNVASSYLTIQWPFSSFHSLTDSLYSMHVGEISSLLRQDNTYYYFFLDRKEAIRMDDHEQEKLIEDLKYFKELAIDKAKDLEIMRKAQPQYHNQGIDSISEYLGSTNDLTGYPDDNLLMEYHLNEQLVAVHLSDLLEPIQHYPIAMSITTKQELLAALNQHIFTAYLIDEALSLDLYNDTQFRLDQHFYTNNQVYYQYVTKELRNTVLVDSNEVIAYYNQNLSHYSRPEAIYYRCFLFASADDAANNKNAIINFYQNNPIDQPLDRSEFPNITLSIPNYRLDDQSKLSPTDIYQLKSLQFGELSEVIPMQNQYGLLLRKNTEGLITMPLNDVYNDIANRLTNTYVDSMLKERILELKDQYSVTDDIDINKWL